MKIWRWLSKAAALAIHGEQLATHGGKEGIRDEGLLESALARPLNHQLYRESNASQLAAIYAHGIVSNHPFIDGNKRTGFICGVAFLVLNRYDFTASEQDVVETFLRVAAGELDEEMLAKWFEKNTHRQ